MFCSVLVEQPSKVCSTKRLKIKVSDDSSHFFFLLLSQYYGKY